MMMEIREQKQSDIPELEKIIDDLKEIEEEREYCKKHFGEEAITHMFCEKGTYKIKLISS